MRIPILIAFMLVTGITVTALSAAAGIGFGGIVLRVVAALVFVQIVYFGALIALAALSGRHRDQRRDAPSAPLKHRSPR
ncbi:MAG: hypothetical protein WBB85_20000 [Albidovulum sp.]|uniref:hypothetical protein n=1 Tax=Albidovulum sp. TaxID=1872424 RepID=UPI003C944DC3